LRSQYSETFESSRQLISKLDLERKRIEYLGEISLDFPVNRFEKNWSYFSKGDDLFLIYSFCPFRVLKSSKDSLLKFKTFLVHQFNFDYAKKLGGFSSRVSLSSNPIDFNGKIF
jgi:hypothetical protein